MSEKAGPTMSDEKTGLETQKPPEETPWQEVYPKETYGEIYPRFKAVDRLKNEFRSFADAFAAELNRQLTQERDDETIAEIQESLDDIAETLRLVDLENRDKARRAWNREHPDQKIEA